MRHTLPRISVIVPAKNEHALLPHCLSSLIRQNDPPTYEIIVVDGNSTDDTADIARSFGVRVIKQSKKGKVQGFIEGANAARGEILCFTEADCVVPDHWMRTIVSYFDNHHNVCAISATYTFHSSTRLLRILATLVHPIANALYFLIFRNASIRGSNSAVRKSAYKKIGGFSANQAELYDVDLGKRLRTVGRIHHVSAMRIETSDRRIRGRFWQYITEAVPSIIQVVLLNKSMTQRKYRDIR